MAPVPGGDELLIANPGDEAIYYYHEGMAAPSGSFVTYGGEPRAIEVVDRSLREAAPGSYRTVGRLPRAGTYDVVLYLDQPRLVHCFEVAITGDQADPPPQVAGMALGGGAGGRRAAAGASSAWSIRPTARPGPACATCASSASACRATTGRTASRALAPTGLYEAEIAVPDSGNYYVFVEAPSVALVPAAGRLIAVAAATRRRQSNIEGEAMSKIDTGGSPIAASIRAWASRASATARTNSSSGRRRRARRRRRSAASRTRPAGSSARRRASGSMPMTRTTRCSAR